MASSSAPDQHALLGLAAAGLAGIAPARHPDTLWFENAVLGLFVHWGISSVHGGIDLSWGMMADTPWDAGAANRNKVTPEQYFALAERFQPDRYDPARWLDAAAATGFRYAVFSTRHHDGYALWPSEFGDFGVRQHLAGRDLVGPFVEACRKAGLKVGLYYSPPDWHFHRRYMSFRYGSGNEQRFPGRKPYGMRHELIAALPPKPPDFEAAYHAYLRGQIDELLTRYGRLDVLWFDGGPAAITREEIRAKQPGILINPRMHGAGDFETPECRHPERRPAGWWERCDTWNIGGWGYAGEDYRSTGDLLSILAETRAWGGNVLINCAPRPSGEMPDLYYSRLRELKAWLDHSGESVFGTQGGPWPERCSVPVSVKANTWYLHFRDPKVTQAVIEGIGSPATAKLLRTGAPVPVCQQDRRIVASPPAAARTAQDDVVALTWE